MVRFADLLGTVSDEVRQAVADDGYITLDEIVISLRLEFDTRHHLNRALVNQLAIKSDILRIE